MRGRREVGKTGSYKSLSLSKVKERLGRERGEEDERKEEGGVQEKE